MLFLIGSWLLLLLVAGWCSWVVVPGVGCMVFWVVFSLWVFVCWVVLGLLCVVFVWLLTAVAVFLYDLV